MGAHPNAFARLAERIRAAKDSILIDCILDQWSDFRDRATEWDASQWGFDPDKWMIKERNEMDKKHGTAPVKRESAANK